MLEEEEASFDDVDLNEAIEDKIPPVEVRGTCCGGVSTTNYSHTGAGRRAC